MIHTSFKDNLGRVESYIRGKIKKDGAILSVVIDVCDYPSSQKAIETGIAAAKAGIDLLTVGGSVGAQGNLLDNVIKGIKKRVRIPLVLFPGNSATISPDADAIFFMSLLNSRNPYWISGVQTLTAHLIKQLKIEPLPMGYILIEPGGTAGWVGDANLVPRNKPQIAAALALAGQFLGQRIIFLDAGSAAFAPIPAEFAAMVRKTIDIPLLVGGGIKTPEEAGGLVKAGADWIQIGTAVEKIKDPQKLISQFIKEVKR
ncbi:MAG: geranylgeranylglyceryl/heptaprenylglyceryl phosphate synthase [Candidatus Nealsonbacteria bacterium CG08_land_8_20_14_0_20_38_20]|uniref:Phosphoglycerol geranylgeranyltransferase n=1 Tax=Candidatus Nealsonbacteria bacterium CG08_land_8_20_14_0_20_38_20 TaxID=1974705 RepID=A0A2H0YLY9_9BACT|nr:MAG: geranylgeranylglyceryl/heptaprenylglyceryl phosphate synthase [Candidatus Nealsonbacteria bacterium CG08_land_8_20_14_0_20_38_20]